MPKRPAADSGHRFTRGYPGAVQDFAFSLTKGGDVLAQNRDPFQRQRRRCRGLPCALPPQSANERLLREKQLACSARMPRRRRPNPITGPKRYVVRSSCVNGREHAPQIRRVSRINNEPGPVEIRKLEELLSTKSRKSERYSIGTRSRRVDQLGR